MQVRQQQLELDMEQQTGSLVKEKWTAGLTAKPEMVHVNVGPWLICQGENVQYPVEMTGRSERKGPLHPQVKEGSSQVL